MIGHLDLDILIYFEVCQHLVSQWPWNVISKNTLQLISMLIKWPWPLNLLTA